jgi:Hemolysin coregulated protein Hcp (TssD)
MSFSSIFKFDGGLPEGYEVVMCDYALWQSTDDKGRPSSIVNGGGVILKIISTGDSLLPTWMLDPFRQIPNASITFMRTDVEAKMKEVLLRDVYCLKYTDKSHSASMGASTMITLSAREMTISGLTHTNNW